MLCELNGLATGGGQSEMAARSAAANRQRFAVMGGDEPLVLESLQRGVDRPDGVVVRRLGRNIAADGEPVCILVKACDGEQRRELERSER